VYAFFDMPTICPGWHHPEGVRVPIVEDETYSGQDIRFGDPMTADQDAVSERGERG